MLKIPKLKNEFNPTSNKKQYVDYSLGYKFKTLISYELGKVKGKPAIRFYIDGKIESVRGISKKITEKNFKMYKCGGQTLHSVRRQREKCLELIVRAYFEKHGFNVRLKPTLLNYHPDIMIKKDNLIIYIELKAYHESYICGDVEISQAMKYYREIAKIKNNNKGETNSKVILLTSGALIEYQNSFLGHPHNKPIQYVESYYKKLIIPRSQVKTLDEYSRRDIYKQAALKFKKNYGNGFPQVKVKFLNEIKRQQFPLCLFSNDTPDVLIIDPNNFYKLLRKDNLLKESYKLKLLKEKEMERLVINGKILKI